MAKETKKFNSFDDFTNLYEVQKTLKFELKPLPLTKKLLGLDNDNVFSNDKRRAENYVVIKEYIDKLHGKFIDAALKNLSFDVAEYVAERRKFELKEEQDDDAGDKLERKIKSRKIENDYRLRVVDAFNLQSQQSEFKDWVTVSNKGEVKGKLFGKELIDILREEFNEELLIPVPRLFFNRDKGEQRRTLREVFNSFKSETDEEGEKQGQNFTTYFTAGFYNNRRNYYKADGKASRVATRVVDENLKRFCDNKIKFDEIQKWTQGTNSDVIKKFEGAWEEYTRDKKLTPEKWKEVFNNTYKYILQNDINLYNFITRKLNRDINESKYNGKGFQKLHKQVHGASVEHEKEIEIDEQNIISEIKHFIKHSREKLKESESIIESLTEGNLNNLENAYLSKRAIETISSKHFVAWHTFGGRVLDYWNKKNKKNRKTFPPFVDLQTIKKALAVESTMPFRDLFKNTDDLYKAFSEGDHWGNFLKVINNEFKTLKKRHDEYAGKLERETDYRKKKDEKEKQIDLIFNFATAAQGIFRMTNYLALRKRGVSVEIPNSHEIHSKVEEYLDGDELQGISPCRINVYFRALKDFVSKKGWIEDKIVLNFDCSDFLGGWAQNYEKYGALIFRKKVNAVNSGFTYYLGILPNKLNDSEVKSLEEEVSDNTYERIVYEFQKMDFKNFPRIFINSTTEKKTGQPVKSPFFKIFEKQDPKKAKEIWNTYQEYKKLDKKGKEEFLIRNKNFRALIIDYFKIYSPQHKILEPYKNDFHKVWEPTDKYSNLSEFYADSLSACYRLSFRPINLSQLYKYAEKGKIYLYQIYNKDFEIDEEIGKAKYGEKFMAKGDWRKEKYKKGDEGHERGKENRDTTLFKLLFGPKNLQNEKGVIYKLSGGAKVFYRPKTKDLSEKGKLRFKEDKYFLHIPIVCNFSNKREYDLNPKVNKLIADTPLGEDKFRIIALDRGEKHLAYLAMLTEEKKLLELRSLNYIKRYTRDGAVILEKNYYYDREGKTLTNKEEEGKNYHALLNKREIERMKARKSWQKIARIKDLKDGFLANLINEVVELATTAILSDKIPILVLENLNMGMMHSRAHIETQIYQRLETRLAQKFNYLTSKKADNFLNAWQLMPKINTYADIENKGQVGLMFYINPAYTSITCPRCGYRDKIGRIKVQDAEGEFNGNIKISFYKGRFVFNCKNHYGDKGLCSDVRRVYWDNHTNNGKGSLEVMDNVTKKLLQLFDEDEYKLEVSGDISAQIKLLSFKNEQRKRDFWARLAKYFNLILQIRNSIKRQGKFNEETGKIEGREESDFIQCPVCHFDSENKSDWEGLKKKLYIGKDMRVELNGDANGAYNIARKGWVVIKKVQEHQQALEKFMAHWNTKELPKKEGDKITLTKRKGFVLTIKKGKDKKDKKEQPYYCVLKNEKEKFDSIPISQKMRKYPDLFISDKEWDEFVQKG